MRQEKQNNLWEKWQNGKNKHEANRFFWEEEKIITQRENKEIKPKRKKNETKRKDPTKRSSRTNEKKRKMVENKATEQRMGKQESRNKAGFKNNK